MKKLFAMLVALGLLLLLVGGCGGGEDIVSSLPESAVDVGSVTDTDEKTTTTTEKETTTEKDHSTTRRCPLTKPQTTTTTEEETTTTTDWGSVTVGRTYSTVSFSRGAAVRERDEVFTEDFRGKVITSKAQLDALALDAEYETDNYDHNFFEDNALVVLEFRLTSGSIQLRVDNVWASGDTMWVRYTTVRPNPSSNDMAYHRILLEISQRDADGIEHILGDRVPIQLPSGADIPNPTAL